MNIVDQIILRAGEKSLLSFRDKTKIKALSILPGYTESIPLVEKVYREVGYWHGTGRYQYAHSDTTRYESLDTDTVADLLESIIQEGGLRPHDEPWLREIQKIDMPTISLSPFRMYAKLYAGLYLYEKDTLEYQFGTTKIWFRIFLQIQLLNKNSLKFLLTKGLFLLVRISTFKNTKLWVRSIRKDGKNSNLLHGHLIHSDIPGNYPILIGIKKNISLIHFNPGMERLEARTNTSVRFEDMTHIEVPLSQAEDTRTFLKNKKVQIPVIPLEYGELYCTGKSLFALTRLETHMARSLVEKNTGYGEEEYALEYFDADSFDNLDYSLCRQVYAVCFCDGQIVIGYRGKEGYWGLIGGTIEKDETLEQTLKREIREESNMEVLTWLPVGYQKVINKGDGSFFYQLRYVCKAIPYGPFTRDTDDSITEIKLIDPSEYKNYFDWGKIGDRIISRAVELLSRI